MEGTELYQQRVGIVDLWRGFPICIYEKINGVACKIQTQAWYIRAHIAFHMICDELIAVEDMRLRLRGSQ